MVVLVNDTWHPLQPGEPIGIVALSGPVDTAKLEAGREILGRWGHPLIEASNLESEDDYLAGSDEERLAGLEEVVEGGARFVIAARGGYGAGRLLNRINWSRLAKRKVSFVGYSDVTAILNPLAGHSAPQFHGPMVAAGLDTRCNEKRLYSCLRGELIGKPLFQIPENSVIRGGVAEGHAVGGNLAVLTSLIGTPWEPQFDGCVLFLEEVAEALFRLDRMLTHLRSSGRLRNVKALIGGSLRGCRPASKRPETWRRLLLEAVGEGVPAVVDLPFGHGAANLAFPVGVTVAVDTEKLQIVWK